VLSGRGLCDELITRPEEPYRLCCVVVCDLEISKMVRPQPALGCSATGKKTRKFSGAFCRLDLIYESKFSTYKCCIVFELIVSDAISVLRYNNKFWVSEHASFIYHKCYTV